MPLKAKEANLGLALKRDVAPGGAVSAGAAWAFLGVVQLSRGTELSAATRAALVHNKAVIRHKTHKMLPC